MTRSRPVTRRGSPARWSRHACEPTLVVVEDAHWADALTLDVLRLLARRIEDVPLVVVVTYRDDELAPGHPLATLVGDLATSPAARRIRPRRLSPDAVAELARPPGATPAASSS